MCHKQFVKLAQKKILFFGYLIKKQILYNFSLALTLVGFGTDCKPQIINKRTLPLFEEHFSVNPLLEPIICIFTNKAKSFLGGGSWLHFQPSLAAFHLQNNETMV